MASLLAGALSAIDRFGRLLGWLAMALFVVLVGAMLWEVVARRVFGAPTLWAYDVAYMLNGALFLLAAALTERQGEHIRIDFLAQRFQPPLRRLIWSAALLVLVLPALGWITLSGLVEALAAWTSGEVERVSPWAPVIWPFYGAIALGLVALTLQVAATLARHLTGREGTAP